MGGKEQLRLKLDLYIISGIMEKQGIGNSQLLPLWINLEVFPRQLRWQGLE